MSRMYFHETCYDCMPYYVLHIQSIFHIAVSSPTSEDERPAKDKEREATKRKREEEPAAKSIYVDKRKDTDTESKRPKSEKKRCE